MQAERVILETDENGHITGLPPLPPSAKIEAVFVVLDSEKTERLSAPADSVPSANARETPVEILKRISKLAVCRANDHFSGEDHDEVLYGWKKRK